MESIVICSTYKAASTSLFDTLMLNNENGYHIRKEHIFAPILNGDKVTYHKSGHLSQKNKTIILIPIRNPKEVYVSALFQDICNPEYEYSPFHSQENIVLWNTLHNKHSYFIEKYKQEFLNKVEKLKEHFYKTNFISYPYLNSASLLKIFTKLDKIPFKKMNYVIREYDEHNTLCFMDYKIIGEIEILREMVKDLNLNMNITDLMKSNITDEKVFSQDYKELKKLLIKDGYFYADYYSFLTPSIYEVIDE
jgi:hypothetical protein